MLPQLLLGMESDAVYREFKPFVPNIICQAGPSHIHMFLSYSPLHCLFPGMQVVSCSAWRTSTMMPNHSNVSAQKEASKNFITIISKITFKPSWSPTSSPWCWPHRLLSHRNHTNLPLWDRWHRTLCLSQSPRLSILPEKEVSNYPKGIVGWYSRLACNPQTQDLCSRSGWYFVSWECRFVHMTWAHPW